METALATSERRHDDRKMTTSETASSPPDTWRLDHARIERRAYEIWKRHGCPTGTEFQDWLAAETELRSSR